MVGSFDRLADKSATNENIALTYNNEEPDHKCYVVP